MKTEHSKLALSLLTILTERFKRKILIEKHMSKILSSMEYLYRDIEKYNAVLSLGAEDLCEYIVSFIISKHTNRLSHIIRESNQMNIECFIDEESCLDCLILTSLIGNYIIRKNRLVKWIYINDRKTDQYGLIGISSTVLNIEWIMMYNLVRFVSNISSTDDENEIERDIKLIKKNIVYYLNSFNC